MVKWPSFWFIPTAASLLVVWPAHADEPRPAAFVELGFEYGRYVAQIPFDATLADSNRAARLAGDVELEESTLGGRGYGGISATAGAGFWQFQGGVALSMRRGSERTERLASRLNPAMLTVVPYSAELEPVARIGALWGWVYIEAGVGVHLSWLDMEFDYDGLRAEQVATAWALSSRLGSGVRVPVADEWYVGLAGGGALLLRPIPVFFRTQSLFIVGFDGWTL
jgi:hypothetical protein